MTDSIKDKFKFSLGSFATIVVGLLALWGILRETNGSYDQRKEMRIEKLETQNQSLEAQRHNLQTQIYKLQRTIETDFNRLGYLESFLDQLQVPAWVKSFDGQDFRMEFVNSAYSEFYDVPKLAYKGNTDYDIWPKSIADGFRKNDLRVYKLRKPIRIIETIQSKTANKRAVIKFIVQFPTGEFGVGGLQFILDEKLCTSFKQPTSK